MPINIKDWDYLLGNNDGNEIYEPFNNTIN
jgi:hypothetical protein